MMNENIYLKLHPSCLAWIVDNKKYGVIPLTSNLADNGKVIRETLSQVDVTPDTIVLEKPFLKLLGDNQRKLAQDILHIQRIFGMLLYILDLQYPTIPVVHVSSKVARLTVYGRESLTKDVQLSEASVLLDGVKQNTNMTPLQLLCLHDCLVLKKYDGDISG